MISPIGTEWEDITQSFREEAYSLELGQLLHDERFTLVEAMSALELMDPKTDSGMSINDHDILSLNDAIAKGALKCENFEYEEIILIMDTICACEVTWLKGNAMAQTLFTCLYLHNTSVLKEECLRVYCLAVLMSSELIRMIVMRADVYEEEDFNTSTLGFGVGLDVDENEIVNMLLDCETKLSDAYHDIKESEDENGTIRKYTNAILKRIQFREAVLSALVHLERPVCRGFLYGEKKITHAAEIVKELISHCEDKSISCAKVSLALGFEAKVNNRLLAPNPPRTVDLVDRLTAYKYWQVLLSDLDFEMQVVSLHSLRDFFQFFQVFSARSPETFVRSRLHTHFWQSRKILGQISIHELLKVDIIESVLPPFVCCLLRDSDGSCHGVKDGGASENLLSEFLVLATKPVLKWFKLASANRARKRRKLARLFPDLSALQTQADEIDRRIQVIVAELQVPALDGFQYNIGLWALSWKTTNMIEFLQLGFELELYAPFEYQYILSYLEYLFEWKITALSKARKLKSIHNMHLYENKLGAKGKRMKKKAPNPPEELAPSLEESFCRIEQLMCRGLVRFIAALLLDERLLYPRHRYDNEQVRYEHRFAPFLSVDSPVFVMYDQFKSKVNFSECPLQELYRMVGECFDYCRSSLSEITFQLGKQSFIESVGMNTWEVAEFKKKVDIMLLAAKMNSVVAKIASTGRKRETTVSFSHMNGGLYPVITLQPPKQ